MGAINAPIITFTGGVIGPLLHNRVDIQSYPTAAEEQLNCWPYAQGPLDRRPPLKFIDEFVNSSQKGKLIPFVFSVDQSYIVLATESGFEFFTQDGKIEIDNISTQTADSSFTENPTVDLTQIANIWASSTGGTGSIAALRDGNPATWWESTADDTQWIAFDFGSPRLLRQVRISSGTIEFDRCPNVVRVEVSTNGAFTGEQVTVYGPVSIGNFAALETKIISFSNATTARYARIVMTGKQEAFGGANEYRIAGIQLYDTRWWDISKGAASSLISNGNLYLDSDGANESAVLQEISTSSPNSYHVIKIKVFHGPINVDVGTTDTNNDLASVTGLNTGTHYITVTPNQSNFFIKLYHDDNAGRIVESCEIVTGTTRLLVEHPYLEEDLPYLHFQQIGDVLYIANGEYWTRKLVRRGHRSWSVERFLPNDGPFGTQNADTMTLAPSATSGQIILTSSKPYFDAQDDEDCLFEITGAGQASELTANAGDKYTSGIKVYGVADAQRTFQVEITGSFIGTIRLQRSSGNENNYTDFRSYTSPVVEAIDDNLDNQVWFYRLAIKPGEFTSGTVNLRIWFAGGSTTGRCRVISVTSPTTAIAEVLSEFSNTSPSTTWKRGEWSKKDGFPVSVTRGFGRLWLGRGIKLWGSKSDNFASFEAGAEADNAISFTLAAPSSDAIRSLAFLQHLFIGTATTESIGLGNTQSEPVGPSNFQIIQSSEEGVAKIMPVTVAGSVLYPHRNLSKLMQFTQNPKALSETSYISVDLNRLSPDLLKSKITSIGVQSEPERRNYLVMGDGSVMALLFRREEDVVAWSMLRTDGRFEDIQVISQSDQDAVYAIVRRKIGGVWKRYIERFGREDPLVDEERFHLDSYLSYELQRPNAVAEPDATSGTITVTTDSAAFDLGDVGSVIWINGGRGQITSYTSPTEVEVEVWSDLENTDTAAPGLWGFNPEFSTVAGLGHLEGKTVSLYGDRLDLGTAVVSGGSVSLPKACSIIHVGLPYESRFKSLKLSYGAQKGTALNMPKAVKNIGFLLFKAGTHGIYFGHSFKNMKPLILKSGNTPVGEPDRLFTGEKFEAFDARYNEDARICIKWTGCAPGAIAGIIAAIDEHDR
jgi:hypothetical protein